MNTAIRAIPTPATVAAAFLIGLAIGFTASRWDDLQWGTVPGAFSGIVSAAAFVFAAVTFRHELATRREEDLKRQASLVDAWVEDVYWAPIPGKGWKHQERELRVYVGVSNASAQAVRSFELEVSFLHRRQTWNLHTVPPTGEEHRWPLASAREAEKLPLILRPWDTEAADRYPKGDLKGTVQLAASFTDTSGNRWRRTPRGELKLLHNINDAV